MLSWQFRVKVALAFFCGFCFLNPQILADGILVTKIEWSGLKNTNKEWVSSYLMLNVPVTLSSEDLLEIKNKLLTTSVFSVVKVTTIKKRDKKTHYLHKSELEPHF